MNHSEKSFHTEEEREILEGFIKDSQELLDEIEPDLIDLQKASETNATIDVEVLNSVFRLFHSLKGAAGYLHLQNIILVTHEAETMLNYLRDGRLQLCPGKIELLIKACDLLRDILSQLCECGSDTTLEQEAKALANKLSSLMTLDKGPEKAHQDDPTSETSAENLEEQSVADDECVVSGTDDMDICIDQEMKEEFIREAKEAFERVELCLMELEQEEESNEALGSAFRDIHSFKGNCGILALKEMEKLSHKMETVLDYMKSGEIKSSNENVSVLLKILDVLRESLNDYAEGGSGEIEGCDILIDLLDDMIPVLTEGEVPKLGEILVSRGEISEKDLDSALSMKNRPLGEILAESGSVSQRAVDSALEKQQCIRAKINLHKDIRVSLDKLDTLNDLVGELVIAQLMVTRNPDLHGQELQNFEKAAHHLQRVTSELQDIAMSLRMIPVSVVFRKMIRLVHDLSRKFNKKVELKMIGEDTEVDKTVVELLSDPLVHIIRNAIDHGIEPPEERKAKGKEEVGLITLEAKHEGGEVWVSVRDNGRGIDKEKVLSKALNAGVIDSSNKHISDEEIFNLVFEPGFSTAEKVTDISGRGVGLDVVRNNIEKLKGKIEILSEKDRGTTFILRIPLTLAIIDGMLVRIGKNFYIIPLLSIEESFVCSGDIVTVTPDGQEYVNIRGKLLPVVRLHEFLNVEPDNILLEKGILLAVQSETDQIVLFIDEICEQQQTVIKGLPKYIGSLPGISGCTILGNGDVGLILDVGKIAESLRSPNHLQKRQADSRQYEPPEEMQECEGY